MTIICPGCRGRVEMRPFAHVTNGDMLFRLRRHYVNKYRRKDSKVREVCEYGRYKLGPKQIQLTLTKRDRR